MDQLKEYVCVEFDQASDLSTLFDSPMTEPTLEEPPDEPPGVAFDNDGKVTARAGRDHQKYIQWKTSCERYDSRVDQKRRNSMHKLFGTITAQCSKAVTSKLKALNEFKAMKSASNCLWLLVNLQAISNRFEESTNRFLALLKAKENVLNHKQKKGQTVTEYYEELKELIDVLESYKGSIHDPAEAAPNSQEKLAMGLDDQEAHMRDHGHAILLLENADKVRFGKLQTDLANDFLQGRDEYPTDMVKAYNLLLGYTDPD